MTDRPDMVGRPRHDTDLGRSGDSLNISTPAALAQGSDDEAAATPPAVRHVEMAREDQVHARRPDATAQQTIPVRPGGGTSLGYWTAAIVCLVLIALAFGLLGA